MLGSWYQDPAIDLTTLPAVTKQRTIQPEQLHLNLTPIPPPDFGLMLLRKVAKDPFFTSKPDNATETLPAREVFHEVQAAMRPLLTHTQTREQVDDLLNRLDKIRHETDEQQFRGTIHDPPVVWHKGRPRTQRLTGATEGRVAGGGGQTAKRRRDKENIEQQEEQPPQKKARRQCALCKQEGHNRATCSRART
ncbi:hypothetical protein C8R45DRAFT_607727 [Mycena sanguinolenta]|nr:hypothetical protein C8R45DRAFT_607727 [Mycena sanguinolenta]